LEKIIGSVTMLIELIKKIITTMTKTSSSHSPEGLNEDRLIAAIGYLGILCVIPLLLKKDSKFAQHHGKQGLVLLISWLVLWIGNIIPILGQLVWMVGTILILILIILGMINALNGRFWEMPVLGKYAKQIKL
jgi:fumarate reductase subunit D